MEEKKSVESPLSFWSSEAWVCAHLVFFSLLLMFLYAYVEPCAFAISYIVCSLLGGFVQACFVDASPRESAHYALKMGALASLGVILSFFLRAVADFWP